MSNTDVLGKWLCARDVDTETWTATAYYDTKEEAIKAGRLALTAVGRGDTFVDELGEHVEDVLGFLPEGIETTFMVGQLAPVHVSVNVTALLEQVSEDIYEEVGEPAEDYYLEDEIPQDKQEELANIIADWFNKNNLSAPFSKITNIEEIDPWADDSLVLVGVRVDVKKVDTSVFPSFFTSVVYKMEVPEENLKITDKQIENRSAKKNYMFKSRVSKSDLNKPIWAHCKDNITLYALVKSGLAKATMLSFEKTIKKLLEEHYEGEQKTLSAKIDALKEKSIVMQ